ncbi:hypothetical protein GCM10010465_16760 [Actinomadura fibrosa]
MHMGETAMRFFKVTDRMLKGVNNSGLVVLIFELFNASESTKTGGSKEGAAIVSEDI